MSRPLYIFDLDGTVADIEHRRHMVAQASCPSCLGVGSTKRAPVEIAGFVNDSMGRRVYLPAMDLCQDCGGTGKKKPDWRGFFAACVHDLPNVPVITTMKALHRAGAEIWMWSARSDEVRPQTEGWLYRQGVMGFGRPLSMRITRHHETFLMRPAEDRRPDAALKEHWLAELEPPERSRLTAVFDDRDTVVAMWRAHGVPCFQVAPGAF